MGKTRKKSTVKTTKATVKKTGRPLLYPDPKKLQAKIDEYFAEHTGIVQIGTTKDGYPITQVKAPTVSGLNYFLGFSDRTSLDEYAKYDGFSLTVKRAKLRIHQFAEQQLFENGKPTGAIFWLKNNGWHAEEDISMRIKEPRRFVFEIKK